MLRGGIKGSLPVSVLAVAGASTMLPHQEQRSRSNDSFAAILGPPAIPSLRGIFFFVSPFLRERFDVTGPGHFAGLQFSEFFVDLFTSVVGVPFVAASLPLLHSCGRGCCLGFVKTRGWHFRPRSGC